MKRTSDRPYAEPDAAVRKLIELAKDITPVQDGRIYIERINARFLCTLKATGPEFGAGIRYAVDQGWLELHESGTFVRILGLGDALLAS